MAFWRVFTVMGLAAGLLAACSPASDVETAPGPEFETRPADAPRAAPEQASQFAFLRYRVDFSADAPGICLGFTHPLDPAADYQSYIALESGESLAVSAEGQTLCLGGMSFGESMQLTLRAGFPAADGLALRQDETIEIDFGDRPAYVGIAGDGVILPRLDADGLAIETVNVEAVSIRLWRITDRALAFRSISSGFNAAEGEYSWLGGDEDPFSVAERIWDGEMDTAGALNTPVTTVFPIADAIGTLQPGAYFIEVDDAAEQEGSYRNPARARRWLVITDLALTAYRGEGGIDYVVRSLQTARPVPGVEVELVARNNEILASATTDQGGRARFDAPLTRGDGVMAPRLLTAYGPDNDFAVLDLQRAPVDLSGQDVGGRQRPDGADGYLYLDRGIYRPGEHVYANALFRDVEARAVTDRPGTLILYGPNGLEADRRRFETAEAAGAVFWEFDLPAQAARGQWRIDAELDGHGRVAQTRFSVEDFVPQRIALDLEADSETPVLAGETRDVSADVRFLYGAPGAGLTVESRIRVETDPNPFPDYSGFRFGRHDQAFREISRDLPDTVADGAGRANIVVTPANSGLDASVPLRIRAVISAIEPGGRAVADDVRLPYRPQPVYLGVEPQFEGRARRQQAIGFNLVALDAQGQLEAGSASWQLLRIDWEYDWYRTSGGRWQWRRSRNVVLVEEGVAGLANDAPTELQLPPMDWGDYQLVLTHDTTGVTSSTGFWVGWGARASSGNQAPDRVRLAGPDEALAVGGEAVINILPPYAGEAEIVIATDRVLETRAITVPEEGAEISLRVDEDWGAGAYVMVSVLTPRDPVAEPRPRRAVGVMHLPVDVSDRTFEIALNAPDLVRPRQTLALEVEADGPVRDGAWITVAAVDEGILALTRFQSPDPAEWYFGKTTLDVDLLDDYGRLLDPNQGAAAAIRSGGDQIGGAGLSVVPTRTVALYSGPVPLDRNGRATVELDIPDFNGELRLMAVAWSGNGVGSAAQPLTVRDQVPAELILPRFLAPGDSSMTTLTLDNVEGAAGQYAARIGAELPVNADIETRYELASGERVDPRHPIAASDTGIGELSLSVTGPDGFAVERSYPLEVRSAWLPYSSIDRGRLSPGESWTVSADALGSFMPGTGVLSVSFSPTPLDEAALLRSLSRYPYGCSEQITSRAMPLLYADQLAQLSGADGVNEARARVQESIGTLLSRQAADGTFGLWRVGDRGSTPWLGVYAVDFLARAAEAGYTVPDAALERAYQSLVHIGNQELWRVNGYDRTISMWRGQTDTDQRLTDRSAAYALYVLARDGRADRSRLRYMHDERLQQIASPLARAQLAVALYLIGDRARSQSAFDAAESALGYANTGDWYQSSRRDLAGVLALAAEAGETERVERLAERVAAELPEPSRLTTQEKAFLLLAARAMGGEAVTINISAGELAANLGQSEFELMAGDLQAQFGFDNAGSGPVWVTQIAHGDPVSAPPVAMQGVVVQKRLSTMDGQPVALDAITQGDRMIIDIIVAPSEMRTIPAIVVDLLPAGFEIEAVVDPGDAGANGAYSWLRQLNSPRIAEARDDRFVAAIDLRERRPIRLAYIVRAVTPGTYTFPGAVMEDMYRPDVFGRSESRSVSIAPREG
ncbi:alpha-2-macroglobulin family protein [Maricaulis sp. MIT060901]|uniref:alpha-2-macroglobulin family protein n=1 Tax=Maricaulis sp. MIT060901 TaxID=3096993 RepID=UPI00399B4DB7